MTQAASIIEILFFEGCPNHEPTLALAREVVGVLGLNVEIREIEIHDERDALRRKFLGSPSVRVDGVDIEPGAAERTQYALGCRVYGEGGVPPRNYLVSALQGGP
jgi:hypothetical protein